LHRNDINEGDGGDGLAFVPTIDRGRDKGQAVSSIIPAQPELILHHSQEQARCLFHNKIEFCETGILPIPKQEETAVPCPYREIVGTKVKPSPLSFRHSRN